MNGKNVVLMRGHGAVACGATLQTAVFRAAYTEVNARIQHWTNALAGDDPIAALSTEEGALADVPNEAASLRAWSLWRSELSAHVDW
jgi:HCOMODA/2-hydroxy-3-carboxy-muconic semialdehyde decarboxylase